jgi:hypothetical protein
MSLHAWINAPAGQADTPSSWHRETTEPAGSARTLAAAGGGAPGCFVPPPAVVPVDLPMVVRFSRRGHEGSHRSMAAGSAGGCPFAAVGGAALAGCFVPQHPVKATGLGRRLALPRRQRRREENCRVAARPGGPLPTAAGRHGRHGHPAAPQHRDGGLGWDEGRGRDLPCATGELGGGGNDSRSRRNLTR